MEATLSSHLNTGTVYLEDDCSTGRVAFQTELEWDV